MTSNQKVHYKMEKTILFFRLAGIFLFGLVSLVLLLSLLLSIKIGFDREKSSPFECGFDNMGRARLPFSLRFFLLTIIFLIFDVEVVLLLPSILSHELVRIDVWFIVLGLFLLVLLGGLFHEWAKGALNWSL